MGLMMMANKGHYVNTDAVSNVIRYVTRTRENETKGNELVCYGAMGVCNYMTPEKMIQQMNYVQLGYDIVRRGGRRIYHEYFLVSPKEFAAMNGSIEVLNQFAMECCNHYFQLGHQVVYAIHMDSQKKLHIHFCVNTINFRTGKKWHDNRVILQQRQEMFNEMMQKYQNIIVPLRFYEEGEASYEKNVCCM